MAEAAWSVRLSGERDATASRCATFPAHVLRRTDA